MKGIIFTEFMEMVEQKWGIEQVDDLLESVHSESDGAYTSVGTYDDKELVGYVVALSETTAIPVTTLIKEFGRHLAGAFVAKYPTFFEGHSNTFSVLRKVDNHIHVEVRKLYSDTELPKFYFHNIADNQLQFIYESKRHLQDLAEGLIQGCSEYFQESIMIDRKDESTDETARVIFTLTKE